MLVAGVFLPVTFEVENGCSMLNSGLSRAQSLSHCCRVQYAGPAQQCIADSSALGVVLWSWANEGTFTVDKGTLQTTVMRCPKQASGGRTPDCDGAPPGVSSSKRLLRTEGGQAETFQSDPKRWAIVNGRVPRPTAETVQSASNQIDQAWPPSVHALLRSGRWQFYICSFFAILRPK